jgi:GTP-binding protein Era
VLVSDFDIRISDFALTQSAVMEIQHLSKEKEFRSGYVAIIGEPNVGKSTLMNRLVGQKISIVSRKPQTTRHKILGILSRDNYQIIFLDTPGLLQPKYLLHEVMMRFAQSAINDADVVLFMTDANNPHTTKEAKNDAAFAALKGLQKPVFLIINKIDLLTKGKILPIIASYSEEYQFKEIFPISALNLFGIDELLKAIVSELPEHPPFYPLDVVSEQPEKFFVEEIIREKIFEKFKEEIPYSTTVDIVEFKEEQGKKDVINAEIYVERESQKGILIGRKGLALKEIGTNARKDMEAFLGRPVFLELHVKVREKWREKEEWLRRLGYR